MGVDTISGEIITDNAPGLPSIYLCGRYARRDELNGYRRELEARGFVVTSRWLDEKGPDIMLHRDQYGDRMAHDAAVDLADIMAADLIVQFSDEPVEVSPFPNAARGGRHFELGFAFATGLHCLVCGPRENIFHYEPRISVVESWPEAMVWIEGLRNMLELAEDGE